MVSVSVLGIINASISVVVCIPFTKVWNPEVAGRCINANAFYIATSTLNMVFDLAIFILPIPIVWEMQRKEIGTYKKFNINVRQFPRDSD